MRFRVVIADDAREIRLLLRVSLERTERFVVVGEAGDGAEAIDVTTRVQPDALILDLSMPLMDGLEAMPAIKEVAPHTLVVVHSSMPLEAEARIAGADVFVAKGVRLDVLCDVLLRRLDPYEGGAPI